MQNNIFYGPLAIGLAICNVVWSMAIGVMIYIGGRPQKPIDGRFFVSDHGKQTEVTRTMWNIARVSEWTTAIGWTLTVVIIVLLILRKLKYVDADPAKNYSILVLVSFFLIVLIPAISYLIVWRVRA